MSASFEGVLYETRAGWVTPAVDRLDASRRHTVRELAEALETANRSGEGPEPA